MRLSLISLNFSLTLRAKRSRSADAFASSFLTAALSSARRLELFSSSATRLDSASFVLAKELRCSIFETRSFFSFALSARAAASFSFASVFSVTAAATAFFRASLSFLTAAASASILRAAAAMLCSAFSLRTCSAASSAARVFSASSRAEAERRFSASLSFRLAAERSS